VKLSYAHSVFASRGESLLDLARQSIQPTSPMPIEWTAANAEPTKVAEADRIYQSCMQRWRIRERFPQPD
jgi:hypothetical protein